MGCNSFKNICGNPGFPDLPVDWTKPKCMKNHKLDKKFKKKMAKEITCAICKKKTKVI